uniref:Uncharacterized protein n=1 Tax=Piliocolobus tephrosceles TaxID=591936 RepID=A0A8C9HF83_9PRIM
MLGWSRRRSVLVSSGQRPGRKGRPRSSRECLPKKGGVQGFCPTCQQTGQPAKVAWALAETRNTPESETKDYNGKWATLMCPDTCCTTVGALQNGTLELVDQCGLCPRGKLSPWQGCPLQAQA